MISKFSDLTEAERKFLAAAAVEESQRHDELHRRPGMTLDEQYRVCARWREIAAAIEHGGKQPHSIEPGRWTELPDAGNGGYC